MSVHEALGRLDVGSTAGAKLVAAGLLPTLHVPGYQKPRVAEQSVQHLAAAPLLTREQVHDLDPAVIVRAGGPQPSRPDPQTGRAYFGFHVSMTRQQAVVATACWWPVPLAMVGLRPAQAVPGAGPLPTRLERLLVTVAGFVVLDVAICEAYVWQQRYNAPAPPGIGFAVEDLPPDRRCLVGSRLPPTRSGNVVIAAAAY
jgi:hypothetical protein